MVTERIARDIAPAPRVANPRGFPELRNVFRVPPFGEAAGRR